MSPATTPRDRTDPSSWPSEPTPPWHTPSSPPPAARRGSDDFGAWNQPPWTPGPPPRRRRPVIGWLLLLVALAMVALSLPATRDALDTIGRSVPGVESLSRRLGPARDVPAGWKAATDA